MKMNRQILFALAFFSLIIVLPGPAVADFSCGRQLNQDGECVDCFRFWFGRTPPVTGCASCSAFCYPFSPNGANDLLSTGEYGSGFSLAIPDYAHIIDAQPCVGDVLAGRTEEDYADKKVALWTPTDILLQFPPYALEVSKSDLRGLPVLVQYALLVQRVDNGVINPIVFYDFSANLETFSNEELEQLERLGMTAWIEEVEAELDLLEFAKSDAPKYELRINPGYPDENGIHRRIEISLGGLESQRSGSDSVQIYQVLLGHPVSTAPVRYSDDFHGNVYSIASIERTR
jgi:hypothetical protein